MADPAGDCVYLWRRVIQEALLEASGVVVIDGNGSGLRERYVAEARAWFERRSQRADFERVCDWADLHPDYVLRCYRRGEALPIFKPEKTAPQRVLDAWNAGCRTRDDIARHTGLESVTVKRHLIALRKQGHPIPRLYRGRV